MKINETSFLKSLTNLVFSSHHPKSIDLIEIGTILLEKLDYGTISTKKELASLNKAIFGIYYFKERQIYNVISKTERTTFLKSVIELILINLEKNSFTFDNFHITTTINTKKELLEKIKEIIILNYKYIIELISEVFENKRPYIVVKNSLKINGLNILTTTTNVYVDHVEVIQEKINEISFFLNNEKDINYLLYDQKRIENKLNEEIKKGKRFSLFYSYASYYSGSRNLLDDLKKDFSVFLKKEEKNEENPIFEITEEIAVKQMFPFFGKINQITFLNIFGEKSELSSEVKANILFYGKFL